MEWGSGRGGHTEDMSGWIVSSSSLRNSRSERVRRRFDCRLADWFWLDRSSSCGVFWIVEVKGMQGEQKGTLCDMHIVPLAKQFSSQKKKKKKKMKNVFCSREHKMHATKHYNVASLFTQNNSLLIPLVYLDSKLLLPYRVRLCVADLKQL